MDSAVRVLIVDDDPEAFRLVRASLMRAPGRKYEIDSELSAAAALPKLLSNKYDVALVDYVLGEDSGLDLLHSAFSAGCQTPMILLTGHGSSDVDLAAMRAGAADYLVKGTYDSALLERSIRYSLERKRSERVLADQQRQLMLSLKMAALGEMAGSVAHEIVNPLSIIIGRNGLLKEKISEGRFDANDILKVVDSVDASAHRIVRIIRALKNFTRSNTQDPPAVVNLSSILDETFDLCSKRFEQAGIRLEPQVNGADAVVCCHSAEIVQALFILLSNAFDAVSSLKDKWVRLEAQSEDGHVSFAVTDSGTGIPPALREKILQPFFTTKDVGRGTGLGLSIARKILAAHQGELSLDSSSPNTRFVIRVPKNINVATDGERRVLVVDDDEVLAELLAETLAARGLDVEVAANGNVAIEKMHQRNFGVIVSDIRMPECDGIQLMERLRHLDRPRPSVVLMTGAFDSSALAPVLSEAQAVFRKPFDMSAMTQTVERLTGLAKPAAKPDQST